LAEKTARLFTSAVAVTLTPVVLVSTYV